MEVAETPQAAARHGILSLSIKDKAVLYAAYMPFLKCGGLFVPTTRSYQIGNDVFMLLKLLEEGERIPVAGAVVWITPEKAQGNRAAGIGVHFKDPKGHVRQKIETLLAGHLHSDKPTNTM